VNDWDAVCRQRDAERRAAVMELPVLMLEHHGVLEPGEPDDVLVSVSIGPSGEAVTVWSTAAGKDALTSSMTSPGWASFPDSRAGQPVTARVGVHGVEWSAFTNLPAMPLAHVTAQPLPDGRFLLAGARCAWYPAGPERNAIIFGSDGNILAEHTLGDGIEHVQTTGDGQVWVGYFDEGVYGNYGWGDTNSPPPIGAAGLLRFSPDLQIDWAFPRYDDASWDPIDDCYALNVTGDDVWVCYHSGFPVVRVRGGRLTSWTNSLASGVRALGVSDTHVALCGGYGPDHDRLIVALLGDGELQPVGEYRLVLPDGTDLPRDALTIGRGGDLHVFVGQDWYRLSLGDVAAASRGGSGRG
jgi:hypothetical protein